MIRVPSLGVRLWVDALKTLRSVYLGTSTTAWRRGSNRIDYTIIGNTVNIASRLESLAEPDQILISHNTYLSRESARISKTAECRNFIFEIARAANLEIEISKEKNRGSQKKKDNSVAK